MKKNKLVLAVSSVMSLYTGASYASDDLFALEEVVVTARKKEESINEVPMSISAASGEMLETRGVTSVEDLNVVVPSFSSQQGSYGNPNYSIRGIGNQSDSLLSTPAVSVYLDQAPLAYSVMSQGLMFDLSRVEVLKGPQGTLFGQNATGGAINFIPNKPGDEFEAGASLTLGRFSTVNVDGFVSMPLGDTAGLRIAGQVEQSDGWQESISRPGDEHGERDFMAFRSILDFEPTDGALLELTLGYWKNESEIQVPRYVPGSFVPVSNDAPPLVEGLRNGIFNPADALYATVDLEDNQLADWTEGEEYKDDSDQIQVVLKGEFDLGDSLVLNSITSYVEAEGNQAIDGDGLAAPVYIQRSPFDITTISQELRLSGTAGDRSQWMLGLSYQNDDAVSGARISTNFSNNLAPEVTIPNFFRALGEGVDPFTYATGLNSFADPAAGTPNGGIGSIEDQDITTKGIFGSYGLDITDTLTMQASARWTESDNDWSGCFTDTGNGILSTFVSGLPPFPVVGPGDCVTILDPGSLGDPTFNPFTDEFVVGTAGLVELNLKEENVSWRLGLDWQATDELLTYANVTRGYKAGNFPRVPSSTIEQQLPNEQEEVTAYETGLKASFDSAQINAAIFYYDYKDKQAVGTFNSPILSVVPAGVSIPEAEVTGFELDGSWFPFNNFRTSFSLTYLDTEIKSSLLNSPAGGTRPAIDPNGNVFDLSGAALPNTSEWSGNIDVEYRFQPTDAFEAYVGAVVLYRDSFTSQLSKDPAFETDDYTTLDIRAGIEFLESGARIEAWGRNVTDEDYLTSVTKLADAIAVYSGRPTTYGVSFSITY